MLLVALLMFVAPVATLALTTAPASAAGTPSAGKCPANINQINGSSRSQGYVVGYACAQVGEPYVFGAAGPNKWDCSGLVMQAYNSLTAANSGVKSQFHLDHSSRDQWHHGILISNAKDLRPGDLIFTAADHDHVQIYVSNGMIVEAANPSIPVIYRHMWGFQSARRLLP